MFRPAWGGREQKKTAEATIMGFYRHKLHLGCHRTFKRHRCPWQTFPPDNISIYGPSRQLVKLLDGVILAAKSSTLLQNHIFFDERFKFHFYDLDICRQAEINNLSCGTWDIALMHESGGSFQSPDWALGLNEYYKKWE